MARTMKFTLRPGPAIQIIGGIADKGAYRAATAMKGRVQSNIRRKGRINTGHMIESLQVRRLTTTRTYGAAYQVYSGAFYTRFQEFGTRAHGPKVASVMVFTPKGGKGLVFAKWVRGVTPGNFFRDALREASPADALP